MIKLVNKMRSANEQVFYSILKTSNKGMYKYIKLIDFAYKIQL